MSRPNSLSKPVLMLVGALALAGTAHAELVKPAVLPTTDPLAPRYEAALTEDGIDFRKPGYPSFLKEVKGVSALEPWGHWTDANLNPSAVFTFGKPLPRKLTLHRGSSAFGPNIHAPATIRAGKVIKTLNVKNDSPQGHILDIAGVKCDTLEIAPAKPTAPKDVIPTNVVPRKLGLGLVTLKIETKQTETAARIVQDSQRVMSNLYIRRKHLAATSQNHPSMLRLSKLMSG